MKCSECDYYEDDNVCEACCEYNNNCYERRKRGGVNVYTCVWNCKHCTENKRKKGLG